MVSRLWSTWLCRSPEKAKTAAVPKPRSLDTPALTNSEDFDWRSTRVLKANVRVIAATNRDLQKAMERGDFREDRREELKLKLTDYSDNQDVTSDN